MDKRIIDKTHIVALKEIKGCLRNVEIPIDRPEQFIAELSAMKENPNRTVWDMQSMFIERSPKNQQWIDHIYPQEYYASFVISTTYPEICMQKDGNPKQALKNSQYDCRSQLIQVHA